MPVLGFSDHMLLDGVFGDGDGVAEAGETVDLCLFVENTGFADGHDVTVTLSTDDPHVQFTDDVLEYGGLPAAGREGRHTAVVIDPSCPQPSFPRIDVEIDATGGFEIADSFIVAVGANGLEDDMESGEGVWSHSGALDLWHRSSNRSHSGVWSWYCGAEGLFEYGINMDASLSTPFFPVGPDVELSFWCWYECATYGTDGVYVDVSDGSGWVTLDFLGSGGALGALSVGNDWLEYTYDLSDFPPGTSIALRFRFVSDDDQELGEGVYIDDVRVGGVPNDVVVSTDPHVPPAVKTTLYQNHPNPFNPGTTIRFVLENTATARIDVFDVRGVRVRTLVNGEVPAGPHRTVWDGRNEVGEIVATGVYFYRLVAGDFVQTKKMILLR
jgi:hypothetical protein